MTNSLRGVDIDAVDTAAQLRFWSTLLELSPVGDSALTLGPGTLRFVAAEHPKSVKNRLHLDLASTSGRHQAEIVERARGLGAVPVDVGQRDVPWVVLADPEGNEFCVLEPRDEYLGLGPVAAVVIDALDPTAQARFWAPTTGLPITREHEIYASLGQDGAYFVEFIRVPTAKDAPNRLRLRVEGPAPRSDPEGNEISVG
ncbi:VOC family protein [Mycolicibacterium sp. S2-37]|uniref:VOC family protein n=1 Tax=Mycolicibacterium sp. S2-37 TaxID=2810297 RepID=UPI001A946B35|nr:VOC family protein [Mycolicibacterium sp. S2-37]MBO0681272.1 VOC family protein [Mycolicibacterium sp. S2-37]